MSNPIGPAQSKSIAGDAHIMEALLQVSLAINAELDISEVLNKVVYWARKLVGCSDASIVIWDNRKEVFFQGASTSATKAETLVRRQDGSTRWIVDNGKPFIIPDIAHDPHTANPMLTESRMRSYAGVPIIHRNQTIAVLYAISHEQRNFDQGEMEILDMLASMAAVSIANAQLVESRQRLHEQRKFLMRLVAHDLLNPITNIQGFFDLLIADLAPTRTDHLEWVEIIHRALGHTQALIQEVNRYEQMVESELLNKRPVDLAEIGRAVLEDVRLSADEKLLAFSAPPVEQKVEVMGDALLLREVVYNLVSNAVKYTPCGGKISVKLRTLPDEVMLIVSDTGSGIAAQEHTAVFDIFTRAANKDRAQGSGLGLHLVKAIVQRHGGDITLESTPGVGSTFYVHLPVPGAAETPATITNGH